MLYVRLYKIIQNKARVQKIKRHIFTKSLYFAILMITGRPTRFESLKLRQNSEFKFMNFYNKYILPKLLNLVMKREKIEKQRPDVVAEASGVVLEIGFGSGLNLSYYKNVTKLYALDPSQELYELAQERIKSVAFPIEQLKISAEKIPLANNSVDSVVSTWSLCSIPRPEVALREIYRVLKSNGKFTFIEHGKSPKNFVAKTQSLLAPIWKYFTGGCSLDREMDKLVGGAGFEIQKLEKFQQKSRSLVFMYKGVAVTKK